MKKRTKQLLSLMISAAMVTGAPCLSSAADFSSEASLADSDTGSEISSDSSDEASGEISVTDPAASDPSPAATDVEDPAESISDSANSTDPSASKESADGSNDTVLSDDASSDNDTSSESTLSEDVEELSKNPSENSSEDFSEGADEDEELFIDDQNPDFSDGNSDGQALGGAVDGNEDHTLSVSANNISDNRYAQNYINYGSVIYSNLMADGNGYIRVEENDSSLLIQQFNTSFQLTSTRTISNELPSFGGFYEGANNYYVVFCQANMDENDSTEVFRLVKYDKS